MEEGKNIPFLDLKRQYLTLKKEVLAKTEEVYESTQYSSGKYVEKFEEEFANYCETKYAIGVNNGTSALHLALLALGIKAGDEVIVPSNTFIASAWAVSYVQAKPVFVDCCPSTWQIDSKKIESKISNKTKAIIGVHLYGQACEIDDIIAISKKNSLFFIEDCAQAHGALYKGKKVGGFGDLACFSFYPGKNLGAYGEAGAITTNNEAYISKIKALRNHGASKRYHHDFLGFNMRMEGIQAAILSIKLKYLDSWNAKRAEIAKRYLSEIKHPEIGMQQHIADKISVFHLFVITIPQREIFMDYLEKEGIQTAMHYPIPCHLQKAYAHLEYSKGDFPNAEKLAESCVSLPMFAELEEAEVTKIIATINKFPC